MIQLLKPRSLLSIARSCIGSSLVPELRLRLLTPEMSIYKEKATVENESNEEPYWAIFWPGGQAITRFVLDNPHHVAGRNVLDLGCGSGACGIASLSAGASRVLFNDVNSDALEATKMNLKENNLDTKSSFILADLTSETNHEALSEVDLILLGDLFFDESLSQRLMKTLLKFLDKNKKRQVFIGDPGRWLLIDEEQRHRFSKKYGAKLHCWAKYELPEDVRQEHVGLTHAFVFGLKPI